MRLLLIIIVATQFGCASIFWQTLGGTIFRIFAAEVAKDKMDEAEKDEAPQP